MKKVIYTSLVGSYDLLKDPSYVNEDWDYICFSNDLKNEDFKIWNIRPIPYACKDKTRLSRYVKLNPSIILKEYDISIWVDANIDIVGSFLYDRAKELISNNVIISVAKHPERDCIYDEAKECVRIGKEKYRIIKKQLNFLKAQGFPEKQGLFENNIIFRQHNNSTIRCLSDDWWEIYMMYSKRDQLSFVYLLYKRKINCIPFFSDGFFARNHPDFEFRFHQQNNSVIWKVKIIEFIKLMLIRIKTL